MLVFTADWFLHTLWTLMWAFPLLKLATDQQWLVVTDYVSLGLHNVIPEN